jgi:rhodanese-related sulfurtransferase
MKSTLLALALALATSALVVGTGACSTQASAGAAAEPALTEDLLKTAAVIDVRTPEEHAADGHLQGDHNIPVQEIEARVADVAALVGGDKTKPVVVYCRSGARSSRARGILEKAGFTNVVDAGGYGGLSGRFPALAAK